MAHRKRKVFKNADEKDKCIDDFLSGIESGEIEIHEIEFVVEDLQFQLESLQNIYQTIQNGLIKRLNDLNKLKQSEGQEWYQQFVAIKFSFANIQNEYRDKDMFTRNEDGKMKEGFLRIAKSTYYQYKKHILDSKKKFFSAVEVEAMIRLYKQGNISKWTNETFTSLVNEIKQNG